MQQLPEHVLDQVIERFEWHIQANPPGGRSAFMEEALPRLNILPEELRQEVLQRSNGTPVSDYLLSHNKFNVKLQQYCPAPACDEFDDWL